MAPHPTTSPIEQENSVASWVQEANMGPAPFPRTTPEPIAIVGMGCRLPGGVNNPSDLWKLLEEKRTGYKEFDSSRFNIDGFYHPNPQRPGSINTRGGHLLDSDPRLFDHTFFSMNSSEVLTMDPMQRKIVEVCYESMEAAGEPWEKFSGSTTGVFIGNFCTDYHSSQIGDLDFAPKYTPTGASSSILSNRVNHLLNLKGPSLTVDTACASSMYALHLAVNALRAGDCDAAIVGGSSLILGPQAQQFTGLLGALSGTSLCHTFDESADGYSRAEGFCAMYLRKHSDAVAGDYPIRAVIRNTAINSNGKTAGISHPGADGQEALIRQAYRNAGLPTHLTGYFECHGTGTPVGDPVEVSAVGKVFSAERANEPLLIGSVKTNLGHSEAASGITGVMKAILALEKGMIPATVGVERLNPNIDFNAAHVKVVTEMTPWPKRLLRRASVNSFGFGGANGHCILDHPDLLRTPQPERNGDAISTTGHQYTYRTRRLVLLPFSAHDQTALASNIATIQKQISSLPLSDVAYTLSKRRSRFLHKTYKIVEASSPAAGLDVQHAPVTKTPATQSARVGFVFTGQGAQWEGMGQELFEYAVFKESIERQDAVLASLSEAPTWTLNDVLNGRSNRSVTEAEVSQTVCTALQVALVDLLRSWGVVPHATVGHSSGEIAATYAVGLTTLEEAIIVAYCRRRSIASNTQNGAMLAVGMGMHEATKLIRGLESSINIAAINSPSSVTLSGDAEAINRVEKGLSAQGVFARLLQTGGNAYHSYHMAAIGERYEAMLSKALSQCSGKTPSLPLCHWSSSVTPHKAVKPTPSYWRQNLENPVLFSAAVGSLITNASSSIDVLIEIGPHSSLRGPLKQILSEIESERGLKSPAYLTAMRKGEDCMRSILNLCGSLFQHNHVIDLGAVNSIDCEGPNGTIAVHGKVCTELPTYQYTYGPVVFYENRAAKELRHRRALHHDLLGVMKAGCAKDQPMWRNVLRLHDIPWLSHHQLIPNAVLPGAAYVCIGIEAAWQFISERDGMPDPPVFKLRNISIKNALRIPDDDLGIEMVTNLHVSSFSRKWLHFSVTSVDNDGNWTENASGLVSIDKYPTRASFTDMRLDARIDRRQVDVRDWYKKFTEIGLGYGDSFQGISELLTDPYRGVASGKLNLKTTQGMFTGPESRYLIHPASLDACFQLALIAFHRGHLGRMKHGFIPVSIDEMTVWQSAADEDWGHAIAEGKTTGLRGAHGKVQIFDQSGMPRLAINDIGCVSYYGGSGKNNELKITEYTRLVWKPDISALPGGVKTLDSGGSERHPFVNLIDLMGHRTPNMRILQIGASTGEVSEMILKTLGGQTTTKRYSSFTVADDSSEALSIMKIEIGQFKHVHFLNLDIKQVLPVQDADDKFDLIVVTEGLRGAVASSNALRNIRQLARNNTRIVVLESSSSRKEWEKLLMSTGMSGIDLEWNHGKYTPASGLVSTVVERTTGGAQAQLTITTPIYVVYQSKVSPFHETLADSMRKKNMDPVLALLATAASLPVGARTIVTIDLEPGGLNTISSEGYGNLKILAQRVSSMLWLTKGGIISGREPEAAIATGLVRTLKSEQSEARFGLMHLGDTFLSECQYTAELIISREERIREGDQDNEIALHDGVLYIPRLTYDAELNSRFEEINSSSRKPVDLPLCKQGPMIVNFATPGQLASAYWKRDEIADQPLPADYVEIKTAAVSLNWRDIAAATGKDDVEEYSSDCAGTVVACGSAVKRFKPGDRVYALAWSGFATNVRVATRLVQLMSPEDTFTQMSTVPTAYVTAVYGLVHLAHLREGERVLIQLTTGGIGLAAIQVARSCKADIYAMASDSEQAIYLRDYAGIPAKNIIEVSFRDEEDISAVMAATGGKGFNVVLATSIGDLMHAMWRLVAPRGHYIDIGRSEVRNRSTLAIGEYDRNATYSSFDLRTMNNQDPEFCGQLMTEVNSILQAKVVHPVTKIDEYDIAQLDKALTAFSQRRHIGKIVVSYENPNSIVKIIPPAPKPKFDPHAKYVLVGGLGGLGRSMARWMVTRGARHLTIFSRSGKGTGDAKVTIEEMEAAGAEVSLKAVDITSRAEVNAALTDVARHLPVRGIIHAAAGFDSTVFENMPYEIWTKGLAAKVQGTINLHEASVSLRLPLDFFVMTSSIQVMLALPAQAAYLAGNAFQDAFARYRHSVGLPAVSIGLGLITEISRSGNSDHSRTLMQRNQLHVHGEYDFLRLIEAAFLATPDMHKGSNAWCHSDPLASGQMLAYGDPSRLATKCQGSLIPKWHEDAKWSHIIQAMMDVLDATTQPVQTGMGRLGVVEAVDSAINSGATHVAITAVLNATIERIAALLIMEVESIDPSRSMAEYGVDSLIAVELRSWIVATFETAIPLLKLLDERLSITNLAESVVEERTHFIGHFS